MRTPDGEDAASLLFEIRTGLQLLNRRSVEMIDQDDVAEAVQVPQSGEVLVLELDPAHNIILEATLNGHVLRLGIGSVYDADGREFDAIHCLTVECQCRMPWRLKLAYPQANKGQSRVFSSQHADL